jgi:hypothetical protein
MPLVALNWSPDTRVLRQFGWIACAVGVLGGSFVWSGWIATVAMALGVFSGAASLVRPAANRPLFVALSAMTYPIGLVVSLVVLAVLFYLVVTPVGLLLRLSGTDPLSRRSEPRSTTYWSEARPARPKSDYFRQY